MNGFIEPDPPRSVMVPTTRPTVTQSTVPSGRLTSLTFAVIVTNPPHAVSFDWSPRPWPLGVRPPIAGPDSEAFDELGACWQAGSPGAGTGLTSRRKSCVADWPPASVTRTVKT